MRALTFFVLAHWRAVVCFWLLALAAAAPLCLRLPQVVQGATETIAGSESDRANRSMQRAFGPGAPFGLPIVVQGAAGVRGAELQQAVQSLGAALAAMAEVREVRHFWNTGEAQLLGRDARSALVLVQTAAASLGQAENLTPALRRGVAAAALPPQFDASVTGTAAMFYDLNRNSSDDLKRAEVWGIPLTLLILLLVFRAPLAALLPLALAGAAALLTLAALYVLSPIFAVSVFAQNAITMIGLGGGVDYALFMLQRFRAELDRGAPAAEAAIAASAAVGPTLLASGAAVGIGFLALFLVNASFLRSVAVGGLVVIAGVLALSLTALPIALRFLGHRVNWPRRSTAAAGDDGSSWSAWARRVMRRPWSHLVPALALLAALAAPALGTRAWNIGASDLPARLESRQGYEALAANFSVGWMGPIAVVIEAAPGTTLSEPRQSRAIADVAATLAGDARVAGVQLVGARDATALLVALPRHAPEAGAAMALVQDLRAQAWPEARAAGLTLYIGGASAAMLDFDAEMFGSLWRVVPAVLAISALALVACFRSLVVPLKAIGANLAAVLGAYGFLALCFGGLNSFIVLMLFTIVFGLSMDYEVFLLRSIQEERAAGRGNSAAVAAGLARSAGLITSAAAVMVCLYASFALTELHATRAFGLGLAAAVALDATLIRLVVIPAAMKLLGEANWWFPLVPKVHAT